VELVKFTELEGKVKNVLAEYSLLKKRNQEVEEYLKKIEFELEGARSRIKELNEERDVICTKVNLLLELLRDIEVVD
jgi:replication initiation and membrane attachment protein DnaB